MVKKGLYVSQIREELDIKTLFSKENKKVEMEEEQNWKPEKHVQRKWKNRLHIS